MLIDFLQFMANLLIAGFILRYTQMKLRDTDIGKALAYLY